MPTSRFFLALAPAVLGLLIFGYWTERHVSEAFRMESDSQAERNLRLIGRNLQTFLPLTSPDELRSSVEEFSKLLNAEVVVGDTDGNVIASSGAQHETLRFLDQPEVLQALAQGMGTSERLVSTEGKKKYWALAVRADPHTYVVQMSSRTSILQKSNDQFRRWLAFGLFGLLAVIATSIFLGTAGLHRDIHRMTQDLEAFTGGDIGRHLRRGEGADVRGLANAMHRMQETLVTRMHDLERRREQLEAMLADMADGVIAINHQGQVLFANQAAHRLISGLGPDSEGRPIEEAVRVAPILNAVAAVRSTKKSERREITLYQDGKKIFLEISVIPFGELGKGGVLLIHHDISGLERLERIRRDFVANASHELRTPLTAIKGFVETLLDDSKIKKETRIRFLEKLSKHVDQLIALTSDLLELSRIEEAETSFSRAKIDLARASQEGVERFRDKAKKAGVAVTSDIPAADFAIEADVRSVEQILDNLLENAIKYNRRGGEVFISLSREEKFVRLEIKDTGIGISPQEQERIWERFYRVDKGRGGDIPGTGLGLAIVKHLVQKMEGRIELESIVGQGSRFSVLFPDPTPS